MYYAEDKNGRYARGWENNNKLHVRLHLICLMTFVSTPAMKLELISLENSFVRSSTLIYM